VLVAGGGTAGHVFPAIALAERLSAEPGVEVVLAGTATGQEARLVRAAGFPFETVEARPLRREVSLAALVAPVVALRSIAAARPLVERADVVVGMGGYVSVPVGLAAVLRRRPLVLHEQNAVPGLANRALARWARVACVTFAEAGRRLGGRTRVVVTGNPVRRQVLEAAGDRERLAAAARRELALAPDLRTLAIFGGSQGALRLNRAAAQAIPRLLERRSDLQVVLLSGPAHEREAREALAGLARVKVLGFLERMELLYAVADLVVARAGATTCAEVSVCGLPAVLVPYPYATGGHQEANARALEREGAAVVVPDAELTPERLEAIVLELLADPGRLAAMAAAMRSWSRPDAAEALAREVLAAGGGS
jgi:UDP-N-acetylglucosamine--N-acetylmuramyl-(pentapeptide) pyrophosphoryl-undecaprenol N-acetylglucosamine transferase